MHPVTAPRHAHRRALRLTGLLVGLGLLVVAPTGPAIAATSAPRPAPLPSTDAASSVLEGIDVSHWQGTIDWTKVAAAGKRFAILKATDSVDFVDDHYATFHAAAKANGIWTGAYHFARPDATAGDAVREADWFASHLNLGAGDLIPALDLEQSGGLSVTALQTWTKAFMDEVTARVGVRPMVYTSPAFWKKYLGDSQFLADAGYKVLWVAHWGVSAPTVPANNWGGRGWTFWQYSDCGSVPGISGCVDLDRYNGIDLSPVAYSTFKLTAAGPSGGVKQGASGSGTVGILRTNFDQDVALAVTGLPAGATATFATNPTGDDAATLHVAMDPEAATTPTGTYPLTITGVSNGLTRTTTMNLVVADGIAPTVTAPFTRLVTGTRMGTAAPVRTSWTATDPSGISISLMQRRTNGGSWSTTTPTTAATWRDTTIAFGTTMQPRVRATDRVANTSAYVLGPTDRATLYQQSAAGVGYTASWRTSSSSSASGGSTKYATGKGASVSYRFYGASIGWLAPKGPTRGKAAVFIDGKLVTTANLYRSSGLSKVLVFTRNWSKNAWHTLKIVVAGTAGHPRVDVDAFVRLDLR